MPTITQIMSYYPIAQYEAVKDINNSGLYGGGKDCNLPQKIYNLGKSIQRVFDDNPTESTLTKTATFLYALCGVYGLKASSVTQSAGTVSPVTPSSTLPLPIEFTVSGSSQIVSGDDNITLTGFIGANLLFVRGNIPQSQINDGGSYYTWNRTTGAFTCYPAAQTGELFQLIPIG